MIYRMKLADSVDEMTFDLLEVPIEDKDIEGATDNTTIDGNIFTDYLWLKKQFVQKWSLMCKDDYTQLRGFYTRQWENAEAPTYTLFAGQNRSETLTASGSAFRIQNGTQYDAPFTLTELKGNATQTTYSGKNLFDYASASDTANTIVSTYRLFKIEGLDVNSTYTLSGLDFTSALSGQYIYLWQNPSYPGGLTRIIATPNEFKTVVKNISPSASGEIYVAISPADTTTWNALIPKFKNAQFEKGTATAYEPYVGGTASPNPGYPQAVNTTTGENVVKIEGKNLSSISQYLGIVWGESEVDYKNLLNTLGAGTYTFSAVFTITERQDTTDDSKYGIYFANSAGLNVLERPQWGAVGVGATATLTKTFTITEAQVGKFTNAYFYGCGGATGNPRSGKADITNIQLEIGQTATSYEPYQGQEYEVNIFNKNLALSNQFVFGQYESGTWNGNISTRATTGWMPVSGGYCSMKLNSTESPFKVSFININYFDENKTWLGNRTTLGLPAFGNNLRELSFELPNTAKYLRVSMRPYGTDGAQLPLATYQNSLLQVERSSTPTAYEAPLELAKIGTYQDRIYKNDGKWYLEKQTRKYTLTGGTLNAGQTSVFYSKAITDYATSSNTPYSEYFTGISNVSGAGGMASASNNTIAFISTSGDTTPRFYIKSSSFANQDALNTWLSTHPTTVYYALATPTTTEITDETLLAQLNFIANLYGGTNNIMLVGTGAQGEIGVEYTLTYEKEQTIIPETTVRLTLTDGGVINTCECRQNVQLTMRETVQ